MRDALTHSGTGLVAATSVEIVTPLIPGLDGVAGIFEKSTVSGNTATATNHAPAPILDVALSNSGLLNLDATLRVTKSTIAGNSAIAEGGALADAIGGVQTFGYLLPTSTTFDRSIVRGNSATAIEGVTALAVGGVLNGDRSLMVPTATTLTNSPVKNNQADSGQGGEATGGVHDLFAGLVNVVGNQVKNNSPSD